MGKDQDNQHNELQPEPLSIPETVFRGISYLQDRLKDSSGSMSLEVAKKLSDLTGYIQSVIKDPDSSTLLFQIADIIDKQERTEIVTPDKAFLERNYLLHKNRVGIVVHDLASSLRGSVFAIWGTDKKQITIEDDSLRHDVSNLNEALDLLTSDKEPTIERMSPKQIVQLCQAFKDNIILIIGGIGLELPETHSLPTLKIQVPEGFLEALIENAIHNAAKGLGEIDRQKDGLVPTIKVELEEVAKEGLRYLKIVIKNNGSAIPESIVTKGYGGPSQWKNKANIGSGSAFYYLNQIIKEVGGSLSPENTHDKTGQPWASHVLHLPIDSLGQE